jgi:glycogen debranching enzyme
MGFFLRASLIFRRGVTGKMKEMLSQIKKEQLESWASSLPELTGKDGEVCRDGCQSQAWSISAIQDILYDDSLLTPQNIVNEDVEAALDGFDE